MSLQQIQRLQEIKTFPSLVKYLRDELDWPIESDNFDDLTFDYEPEELGIDAKTAVKIKEIKQLRPLSSKQPWGIFFINFEPKQLPIVVLRRILRSLVIKKRASANKAQQAAWQLHDLLFISSYGEVAHRELTFAHFSEPTDRLFGDLPTLRVLGWDDADTKLKIDHVVHTLSAKLRWPADENNTEEWRNKWSVAFELRPHQVITTSKELAILLADLAKSIRQRANLILDVESERGPLRKLHKAFQTALIHDLNEDDFADMYAQTIAYGLLAARVLRPVGIVADNLADMVPITNPFLKEMLGTFLTVGGRKGKIDFDELGIQEVVDLLNSPDTNVEAVLRDFGKRTMQEDPVVHFYELFLKEYDKKKKVERGVFYTPQPVVSYIVRSVHELLKTEFGLEDGLASTVTWGEMVKRSKVTPPSLDKLRTPPLKLRGGRGSYDPERRENFLGSPPLRGGDEGEGEFTIPEGVSPDEPFVLILDIATGTATFLVEVIEVIHNAMEEKWKKEGHMAMEMPKLWNEYVPKHLLPRLYGYELMMAPYAIAHMKIGLKLAETGYRFGSNERAHIYLTNSLEPPSDIQADIEGLFPALAHEAKAVNAVKRHKRFTVVMGNPPYSVTSVNFNPYISSLMNDYKKHVRGEQGLVALADDYLKFIRLSQELLRASGCGLWGMITNHGYLKGLIHRGVRKELLSQFNTLFVLDLHGDSNIGEHVPTGKSNENVFDIQQGVSVSLGIRSEVSIEGSTPRHSDLWGTRKEKYDDLNQYTGSLRSWINLKPTAPNFFLIPFDDTNLAEYQVTPSISELMPVNSCGVKTHRDGLVIDCDQKELILRMSDVASDLRLEVLRERYGIIDTPHWNLKDAKAKIKAAEVPNFVQPITYRPFDNRWIYYNPSIIEKGDSKFPTLRHMLRSNLVLLTARIQATGVFNAVFVSKFLVEMKTAESSRSCTAFPLFLNSDGDSAQLELHSSKRTPNFNPKVLNILAQKLGVNPKGDFGLPQGLTPEDIFHYIYAVFHSPTYRIRYSEFLKIDFPRLPLTSSIDLFKSLAKLGGELVALHLMEFDVVGADGVRPEQPGACHAPLQKTYKLLTTFVGAGVPVVEKISYSDNTVWIDKAKTQGFQGVPENVWNFHIGGYQVCEKWLKDRGPKSGKPGRTLSADDINHYHRIVVALSETIRIMTEIDKVIEAHGGWPDAFAEKQDEKKTTYKEYEEPLLKAAEESAPYKRSNESSHEE